jgi:hypothetical protein
MDKWDVCLCLCVLQGKGERRGVGVDAAVGMKQHRGSGAGWLSNNTTGEQEMLLQQMYRMLWSVLHYSAYFS